MVMERFWFFAPHFVKAAAAFFVFAISAVTYLMFV